jgi:hypothetical protein
MLWVCVVVRVWMISFWLFLHVVLYVNGMVQTPVSHLAAPFE